MASAIEQYPFWPKAEVAASSVLKVVLMERRVLNGRTAIITTIIMGKREIVLTDMYTMKRFIGACLIGARAVSQDRPLRPQIGVIIVFEEGIILTALLSFASVLEIDVLALMLAG